MAFLKFLSPLAVSSENWYELIEESLVEGNEDLQRATSNALTAFLTAYENKWRREMENAECYLSKKTVLP